MSAGDPLYQGQVVIESPTHAGGVVVRDDGPVRRFLLVTARRQPGQWVFPKGHIEAGETAEAAAVREVLEESGVVATVVSALGASQYRTAREVVRAQFFLMRYVSEEKPGEGRSRGWFTASEAQRALLYEDARLLIAGAAGHREQV